MGIAGVSLLTHLLFWVNFNEIVIVIVICLDHSFGRFGEISTDPNRDGGSPSQAGLASFGVRETH